MWFSGFPTRLAIGSSLANATATYLIALRYLKTVTPRYVDVRACLQARVEEFGGGVLELVAAKVDANQLFGNPLPGKKKELRVRYLVVVSALSASANRSLAADKFLHSAVFLRFLWFDTICSR